MILLVDRFIPWYEELHQEKELVDSLFARAQKAHGHHGGSAPISKDIRRVQPHELRTVGS
jgi:hypothetical protein